MILTLCNFHVVYQVVENKISVCGIQTNRCRLSSADLHYTCHGCVKVSCLPVKLIHAHFLHSAVLYRNFKILIRPSCKFAILLIPLLQIYISSSSDIRIKRLFVANSTELRSKLCEEDFYLYLCEIS